MSPAFEAFLAKIFVDEAARNRFLQNPSGEAQNAGLGPEECAALCAIDRDGLELACSSFERKRRMKRVRS
jgi:hypothetical protein